MVSKSRFAKIVSGAIDELRELERESFRQRHGRTDFYGYLSKVLEDYIWWRKLQKKNDRSEVRQILIDAYKLKMRKDKRLLHYLIEASSKQDVRMRNRWVRALRFAYKHRSTVEQLGFEKFVKKNGGIAFCADKWTKKLPASK